MAPSKESLRRYFADVGDDELARAWFDDPQRYTPEARSAIAEEMARRGLAGMADDGGLHAPPRDAGLRCVDICHRKLMIDEEWTVRRPRGFSWLGWRLMQHFDVTTPFEDVGMLVARVRVRIEVLRNVRVSDRLVELHCLALNRLSSGSAWLFDPDRRTLSIGLAQTVHDETADYRGSQIADYAILQLIEAERLGEALADQFGAELAIADHPARGHRVQPDEMLSVGDLLSERSGERSLFADPEEMKLVYEYVKGTGGFAFSAGYDESGVVFEVPFGKDDTALVELHTTEPHPRLGNGLLALCRIRRHWSDLREALGLADRLNREAFGEQSVMPLVGAWVPWNQENDWTLTFCCFVPNLFATPGTARDLASAAMLRLALLDRAWYPGLGRRSALEIIVRRMGVDLDRRDGQGPDGLPPS